MASYEKVTGKKGTRWRASVNRQGYRKSKTFGTKKDAERWARQVEGALDTETIYDARLGAGLTLDAVWQDYMTDRGIEWAETTAHTIKVVGKALGDLGKRPVQTLTRSDIQAWVHGLNAKYQPSTVRLYFVHLKSCLEWAQRAGLIQTCPADQYVVRPPAKRKRGQKFTLLDDTQIDVLCETIRAGKSRVSEGRSRLIRVLVSVGMRWEEAVALTIHDVEFTEEDGALRCDIDIHRGISGVNSRPVITTLKTESSHRRVPAYGAAAEAIRDQYDEAVAEGRELLWVTVSGRPMTSPTGSSWWHTAIRSEECVEAGVPGNLRIHDLRHCAATNLIQRGVPITAVSRHLGHARTSTTLDVYSHYIASDDAAIRAAMGG